MRFSQKQLGDAFWFQEGPGVRKWQFTDHGVKLLNVGNILKSGTLDLSKTERHLSLNEVEKRYAHFLADEGDLVIASSGISIEEDGLLSTRGAFVEQRHLPLCMNTSTIRFKAKDGISDLCFLKHWLGTAEFREQITQEVTGIAQKNFGPSHLSRLNICLPPLEEQNRIAAVLDKADALRRKRQEALRLTDDFLRSTFLDLFGDLRTNSKGWPMRHLSEGVAEFEGGRNFNPTDTPRSDGFKVLKVSAVTSGEYAANESKHFSEADEVPAHYLVRPEDLLISRANTAELVGAVAYVWETQGTEVLPDKLWRFVWPEQPTLEPLFMLHLARSPYFRDQLIQRATGSSGSMKNIGKAKMLEIPVPYPPYTLQQRFSDIAKQVQKTARRSSKASQETETLFSALQQRAFCGEL